MFGPGVALLTVLLLALSPWHLQWSQNARFYTSLLLFYSLAMFYLYFGLEEDNLVYLAISLVFLGIATLERKVALFYAPIAVVYLAALVFLPIAKPAGLRRRLLTGMALPVVAFGLYEVYAVGFAGQEAFFAKFVSIFIGHQHNPLRVLLSVISDLGLPVFLLALAGAGFLVWERSRAGLFLAISTVLPLATIVLLAPFTQTFSRYVFHTLPFWLILAAVAVKELYVQTHKHAHLLALGVLLVLVVEPISQDVLYYSYQNGNRQDWKGAFAIVERDRQPGDQVVTTRTQLGEYYLDGPVVWAKDISPKKLVAAGLRTWFVIDDRTGFVSPELQRWLDEDTRLVGVRDVHLPGLPMEMRVYLYDPPIP
jgi:hypothetical protein